MDVGNSKDKYKNVNAIDQLSQRVKELENENTFLLTDIRKLWIQNKKLKETLDITKESQTISKSQVSSRTMIQNKSQRIFPLINKQRNKSFS